MDINRVYKAGLLTPGRWGGWKWTVDGEKVASISTRASERGLELRYWVEPWGEERHTINYTLPVVWRPCTFGGRRPYLLCQGNRNGRLCGRPVLKLFLSGRYFLCRHCHNLAYASQSEEPHDRLLRRANKKRMMLGGEPGTVSPIVRPKGMWQRTFETELQAILEAEEQADAHFMLWFLRRFPGGSASNILG